VTPFAAAHESPRFAPAFFGPPLPRSVRFRALADLAKTTMFPSLPSLAAALSQPFKRSQLGLFHGKTKQYGNNVPFSKKRHVARGSPTSNANASTRTPLARRSE